MSALGEKRPEQPKPQRILAIDYGRKRIGLAISDELGLTSQPLAVVVRRNRAADLKSLREICGKYAVNLIVVGHPIHITGDVGEMAGEAARFAARLAKNLKIETEMLDERLTSWQARQTISETSSRQRRKSQAIDDVAAAVLLRDYLELRRSRPISLSEAR